MHALLPATSALLRAASLATNVASVQTRYRNVESKKLVPMVSEVVRFATFAGNAEAHAQQKEWLMKTAANLGFVARDAGKITEIELPGPPNAPVLGLIVHGDVQPVEADAWSFPPFSGRFDAQYVYGRGTADDKGPLVQALLAMKSLEQSGIKRTHTIRLLIGSEEESAAGEVEEYLKDHQPPDYTLVIDSEFPVVVGEKAWNALAVEAPLDRDDASRPYVVADLMAGLSASIVPDRAELVLQWREGTPQWDPVIAELKAAKLPEGTRLATQAIDERLRVVAYGRSAHSGVNMAGGRNALVALAHAVEGKLPRGGADDLLAFARTAGRDIYGTGLGILERDPIWGRYTVNVATIKPKDDANPRTRVLTINIRSTPSRTGEELQAYLEGFVRDFNRAYRTSLVPNAESSYYGDKPLGFDPNAKLVKRLLAAYTRATGEKAKPAISGGGTYAKRLPNAIAFGMWFPGKPYPGHDVNEKAPIADLHRGTRVLIEALVDIATGEKMEEPFAP